MVLSDLHELISKVCPINGVADLGNGQFRIDYKEEVAEFQKQAAQIIINNWPLKSAKIDKINKINLEWEEILANGWDSGQGKLGLKPEDVALLSGVFALAKEASILNLPIPSIFTMDSQEITFSNIQNMTMFMLQYGQYRSNISSVFAAKRRAVENATTIDELDNL